MAAAEPMPPPEIPDMPMPPLVRAAFWASIVWALRLASSLASLILLCGGDFTDRLFARSMQSAGDMHLTNHVVKLLLMRFHFKGCFHLLQIDVFSVPHSHHLEENRNKSTRINTATNRADQHLYLHLIESQDQIKAMLPNSLLVKSRAKLGNL